MPTTRSQIAASWDELDKAFKKEAPKYYYKSVYTSTKHQESRRPSLTGSQQVHRYHDETSDPYTKDETNSSTPGSTFKLHLQSTSRVEPPDEETNDIDSPSYQKRGLRQERQVTVRRKRRQALLSTRGGRMDSPCTDNANSSPTPMGRDLSRADQAPRGFPCTPPQFHQTSDDPLPMSSAQVMADESPITHIFDGVKKALPYYASLQDARAARSASRRRQSGDRHGYLQTPKRV